MEFGLDLRLQLEDSQCIESRRWARVCVTKAEGCDAIPWLSRNATRWKVRKLVGMGG
jgi:hypothetical protein